MQSQLHSLFIPLSWHVLTESTSGHFSGNEWACEWAPVTLRGTQKSVSLSCGLQWDAPGLPGPSSLIYSFIHSTRTSSICCRSPEQPIISKVGSTLSLLRHYPCPSRHQMHYPAGLPVGALDPCFPPSTNVTFLKQRSNHIIPPQLPTATSMNSRPLIALAHTPSMNQLQACSPSCAHPVFTPAARRCYLGSSSLGSEHERLCLLLPIMRAPQWPFLTILARSLHSCHVLFSNTSHAHLVSQLIVRSTCLCSCFSLLRMKLPRESGCLVHDAPTQSRHRG